MKPLIISSTIALALSCVAGASGAQDASHSANLQNVTITAPWRAFETYTVNLNADYGLRVLVGDTHRQYMQAQRAAENSEALRVQGKAPSPYVEVALDNSPGTGMARRIVLSDPTLNTASVVDVYCRSSAVSEDKHCRLVLIPVFGQHLASSAAPPLQGLAVSVR